MDANNSNSNKIKTYGHFLYHGGPLTKLAFLYDLLGRVGRKDLEAIPVLSVQGQPDPTNSVVAYASVMADLGKPSFNLLDLFTALLLFGMSTLNN